MNGTLILDRENPWPGLASYDEAANLFFSGRSAEIAELARRIVDESATLLFGKSGLGKSSLLRAGVFPVLRSRGLLPVLVRLCHEQNSPPLMDQIATAMFKALADELIEHPPPGAGEMLWQFLHRKDLKFWTRTVRPVRPVVVIDQFEEVFTVGRATNERITAFREELADLTENRIPAAIAARYDSAEVPLDLDLHARPYKVVVALREDFLPDLEDWLMAMPSLGHNRMRLLAMGCAQALQAVYNEQTAHLVDKKLAERIVDYLATGPSRRSIASMADPGATIDPALLSLVCRGMNEARKLAGKPRFDDALFDARKGRIVSDFYHESIADQPLRVRCLIENELVTAQGFRNSYAVVAAIDSGSITREEITKLVDRRLLRIEHQLGTERLELTHDLLTRPVLESRTQRVAAEHEALERRRLWKAAGIAAIAVAIMGTFAWQRYERLSTEAELKVDAARKEEEQAKREAAQAENARKVARSRELALASNQMRRDGSLALLLSLEAMEVADTQEASAALLRAARNAWPSATLESTALGGTPTVLAMDSGGARLAVAVAEKQGHSPGNKAIVSKLSLTVWALQSRTPQPLWRRSLDSDEVSAITFSADAQQIFVGSAERIDSFDANSGNPRGYLPVHGHIGQIAVSADGRWLGITADHKLLLRDLRTERAQWKTVRQEGVDVFAISRDGQQVFTARQDPLRVNALHLHPDGWHAVEVATQKCTTPQSISPASNYVIATWKAKSCTFGRAGQVLDQSEDGQSPIEDSLASHNGYAFVAVLTNGDVRVGHGTPAKPDNVSVIRGRSVTLPGSLTMHGLFSVNEAATRVAMLDGSAQRVDVFNVGPSRLMLTSFAPNGMTVTRDGRWIVYAVPQMDGTGWDLRGSTIDDVLGGPDLPQPRWTISDLPEEPLGMVASRESVLVQYKNASAVLYDAASGTLRNTGPLPTDVQAVGAENTLLIVPPSDSNASYRVMRMRDGVAIDTPWDRADSADVIRVVGRADAPGLLVARRSPDRQRTVDMDGYIVQGEQLRAAGRLVNVPDLPGFDAEARITDDGRAIRAGFSWYDVAPGTSTDAELGLLHGQHSAPMGPLGGGGVQARSAGGAYRVEHIATRQDNVFDARLVTKDGATTPLGVAHPKASYWFSADERWLAYKAGKDLMLLELGGQGRTVRLEQIDPGNVVFVAEDRLLTVTNQNGKMIVPVDGDILKRFARWLAPRTFLPNEICEFRIDESKCLDSDGALPKGTTASSARVP